MYIVVTPTKQVSTLLLGSGMTEMTLSLKVKKHVAKKAVTVTFLVNVDISIWNLH